MTTAQDIITPAQDILNDANVRWLNAELLRWIDLGQKTIIMLRPDANAVGQNIPLIAGTRQTLPTGGLVLLDIARNMGADGATPGRPVRLVQREMLDLNPTWHSDTPSAYVTNYTYDERIPDEFWVYPPATAGIHVFGTVSMTPSAVDDVTDDLSVGVLFEGALMDYMLFRAFSKEDEVGNQQRAVSHFQAFALAIGEEAKAKIMKSPNTYNFDGVPPRA